MHERWKINIRLIYYSLQAPAADIPGSVVTILFRREHFVVRCLSVRRWDYIVLGDKRFIQTSVHVGCTAYGNENPGGVLLVDLSKNIEAVENGVRRDDHWTSG